MSSGNVSCRKRLLFASYHCYVDPSSGAAVSTRELLVQLGRRGWDVRTLCGAMLDIEPSPDVRQILADEHFLVHEATAVYEGKQFSVLSFRDGPVRSSLIAPAVGAQRGLSQINAVIYLHGFQHAIDRWRPDILLTYGGNPTAEPMFRESQRRGIPVVFWLHNFAYREARLFEAVERVIVPSECSARHHRVALGLECTVLPCPLDWERVTCDRPGDRGHVTFVNPQPHKGVFVFARIAEQLYRLRPEIPLLIVEGRSGVEWLEKTELDLSGLTNLNVMRNTPDARDFYRASRVVLMPSLCRESFGRVAAEAMINGIPVLASNRGALPEIVGDGGLLFRIPDRYTPEGRKVPTSDEVRPWVETIIRLWEDREFYEETSRRCRCRAERWKPALVLPRYEQVFAELMAAR